jgi:hypothetical protein
VEHFSLADPGAVLGRRRHGIEELAQYVPADPNVRPVRRPPSVKDTRGPYPLTIVPSRYRGIYEGRTDARYAAFLCDPSDVPDEAFGDDVTAAGWWSPIRAGTFPKHPRFSDVPRFVAVGATPDAAEENLAWLLESNDAPAPYR